MQNHTTTSTREALAKDVDTLKTTATQVVQDVKDHASAHVDQAKQRVTDTIQSAQDRLTENPWTLLGIGFGIGVIVGLRLRR
jgi:ElaB/YqjD/DUF883 family membrane-anchored ribosome-binding protein